MGLISKQIINWSRCLVLVGLGLLMGYAVHGVFGVLLTSLEFIFSPVTDPGSLQSLNTF